jgi:hypothetical protein
MITGERATGRVGTVQTRSETDDEQPRSIVTERRDRRAVIGGKLPAAVSQKRVQPRAAPAMRVERW